MRPEVQIKFQKIIQSFKDGNFYHAESMISVMLQEDHGNFNSIFQLGISYAKNGEHDLALRVLTLLYNQF
jgi:Flp pilus assembly protein TadD